MTRMPALLLAAALAAALPGAAQARADAPTASSSLTITAQVQDPAAAIRAVERGRPGRRVGVRIEGQNVVVVWEYPGGRVVDIVVNGRTGRILGER